MRFIRSRIKKFFYFNVPEIKLCGSIRLALVPVITSAFNVISCKTDLWWEYSEFYKAYFRGSVPAEIRDDLLALIYQLNKISAEPDGKYVLVNRTLEYRAARLARKINSVEVLS